MRPETAQKRVASKVGDFKPITCGTDFSENAGHAVRVAAALGRRLDERVSLVNVLESPSLSSPASDVLQWLKANRRKALREEAEQIRASGTNVEEQLIMGRPDEVLVDLARKRKARLLVLSSLGRRGFSRWFLGSVSERTAELSTVPTLVVRDAAPFESWTKGERPLKVFVAFNFTVTSETALGWVKELLAIGPCEVVVGYVDWQPEQRTRLGGSGSFPVLGNLPDVQAVLERDVRARAIELLGDIPVRLRIEATWGRPDALLAEMASEEGADLVVVGSHQYRGFERLWSASVSRGLLHDAKMSVAVVPLATRRQRAASIAPPIRRALVTTDFSELANHAIPVAYSLMRGGGTVHLIHVVHPDELPEGQYAQGRSNRTTADRHAKYSEASADKLRALIPEEAAALGIMTETEIAEHRDVAEGVCQAAERFGADVICLGDHRESGVSKSLLGSVTQKIMKTSRRPLMIIRPPLE